MRSMKNQRLARVSPWLLAAACGLLTLIIGVFAVNNYRRDKALMTDILLEKGATLIRFVASSSRNSIFAGLRQGQDINVLWPGNVQQVLEHASGHPGVKSLALVDSEGFIIANSVPEDMKKRVSEETRSFIQGLEDDSLQSRTFSFRIRTDEKQPVFQMAALSPPFGRRFLEQLDKSQFSRGRRGERMPGWNLYHGPNSKWRQALEALHKKRFVILVELDMEQFNQRLQRQKLEIIILSIVLLLVGFGGWLSILTLEGLKGSQSRLRRVEAFRDILISSLPAGLIATDNSGKIILCNKFSQEFTGVKEEEALGQSTDVFHKLPELQAAFEFSGAQQGRPAVGRGGSLSPRVRNYADARVSSSSSSSLEPAALG